MNTKDYGDELRCCCWNFDDGDGDSTIGEVSDGPFLPDDTSCLEE
jgi:hypothetical protein